MWERKRKRRPTGKKTITLYREIRLPSVFPSVIVAGCARLRVRFSIFAQWRGWPTDERNKSIRGGGGLSSAFILLYSLIVRPMRDNEARSRKTRLFPVARCYGFEWLAATSPIEVCEDIEYPARPWPGYTIYVVQRIFSSSTPPPIKLGENL